MASLRTLKHLYRFSEAALFQPTQMTVPEAERTRLIQEITASGYMQIAPVQAHFAEVSHIYQWKTPTLQIDLWVAPNAASAWSKKMDRIIQRLNTLRVYYHQTRPIRFVCIPMDIPRQFPESPKVCMDKSHVNGGYTYLNGNTIYILRKEEMPKVMLHEYLHQIQGHKDAEWAQHPEAMARLHRVLGVPTVVDLRPNESVVEYWARYYHQCFISIETGIPFKDLWKAEQAFILQQARRIWTHQTQCAPVWTEGTSVFSYYILKTLYATSSPTTPVWRLDYSVPELVAWIESQWALWKKNVLESSPSRSTATSSRMTLLGDL